MYRYSTEDYIKLNYCCANCCGAADAAVASTAACASVVPSAGVSSSAAPGTFSSIPSALKFLTRF